MPIRTDLWKVSAKPEPLPEAQFASEEMLEDMIVATPKLLSDEWMLIGRQEDNLDGIRYQLLHRTASPLLEAKRFNASVAIMVVQSFGSAADEYSYKDFTSFCTLMGCQAARDALILSTRKTNVPLLLGWIDCQAVTDAQVAKAME